MGGFPGDTAPDAGQREGRKGLPRRRGPWTRYRVPLAVAVILVILVSLGWFSSGFLLQRLVDHYLPENLRVSDIALTPSGDVYVGRVQVMDARGTWLEIKDLRVTPDWKEVIRGKPLPREIRAHRVYVDHRPAPKMPFRIPAIPVWQALPALDRLDVHQLVVGEQVTGHEATYRVAGHVRRDRGGPDLTLRLTDDGDREITVRIADAASAGDSQQSRGISVTCEGLEGQILPFWLGISEAVTLRLGGSGCRERWTADVSATEATGEASIALHVDAEGYETVRYTARGEFQNLPGNLPGVPARAAGGIGRVFIAVSIDPEGMITVNQAEVNTSLVSLAGSGTLNTRDWAGEGESTLAVTDLVPLLHTLAGTARTGASDPLEETVPASFSGKISRRRDAFHLEGTGSVRDVPMFNVLLERTRDGVLRGEGRIDLDRVPLPETWRAVTGPGIWQCAATGHGDQSGWHIEDLSLASALWQVSGTLSGTGWNLDTLRVDGKFSGTFAGTDTPWGNVDRGEGTVQFSGSPDALSLNANITCGRWTWTSMTLDRVNASVLGIVSARAGAWADRIRQLTARVAADHWTHGGSIDAPAGHLTLARSDDGLVSISGRLETAGETVLDASGTWRPDTGDMHLGGKARVNLAQVAPWLPEGAGDARGTVSGTFHVERSGMEAPLKGTIAVEGSGLEVDEKNALLRAFLMAVDRNITCEGQVQYENTRLTGNALFHAPSLKTDLGEVSLEVNTASGNWSVALESRLFPSLSGLPLLAKQDVPSWIESGEGTMRAEIRGTGSAQPEEVAGVFSWDATAGDTPLRAAAAGARLRRDGREWQGDACLLAIPRGTRDPIGISGKIRWNDMGGQVRKARVGVAAATWWNRRESISLMDKPAFTQSIGTLDGNYRPGDFSATVNVQQVDIPTMFARVEQGSLSGSISARYASGKLRVTADGAFKDLASGGLFAREGKGSLAWEREVGNVSKWQGRVEVTSGHAGEGVLLEEQVLTVEKNEPGQDARWTLSGRVMARAIPADYQLEGVMHSAFTGVTIDQGSGHAWEESWRLGRPVTIRADADGVTLESARVEVATGGFVEGEGRWRQEELSGHVAWDGIPLTSLAKATGIPGFRGTCRGRVDFTGDAPDIQGNLEVGIEARPAGHDNDPASARAIFKARRERGGLTTWTGEVIASGLEQPFNVQIEGQGTSRLGLRPYAAAWSDTDPLRNRITVSGDLGYLVFLTGQDQFNLKGMLSGAITWERQHGGPGVSGAMTLQDGYFEDYRFGTILRNITCEARTDGTMVRITRFSAEDGRGGTIQGGGILKGGSTFWPELDIHLGLDHLRILRVDYAAAMVSGDLALTGVVTGPLVAGRLHLDQGVIEAAMSTTDRGATQPVVTLERQDVPRPDTTIKSKDSLEEGTTRQDQDTLQKEPERTSFGSRVRCDVSLDIPGQLMIRSPVLQSEWQGSIQASGPIKTPTCRGEIRTVRGNLNFFGKRLDISESRVTMNEEDLYRPYLVFRAVGESGETTVRLALEGEPGNMTLSVNSTPELPPEEALSRLLFRRGTAHISPLQALQVARAASLLGRRFTLLQFLGGSFRIPGMDAFDIRTGDTLGETAVGVSRSIGDRVYVQAEQGLTQNSGKVSAEIEVTPNIRVKVDAGANESGGGGVFWKKEY